MTNLNEAPNPSNINDMRESFEMVDVARIDHLPIISVFCRRIGLIETVNALVPTEMKVDAGTIVFLLVVDTLSGRSPLYRLTEVFEHHDLKTLVGRDTSPEEINDSAVGRVMDRIYRAGTSKIFSQISLNAVRQFDVEGRHVHYDTTSVSVWGDGYDSADEEAINITYGHSKDHRPDLKQFLTECLCVERNIPIFGRCADGNASDKTLNNTLLTKLVEIMAAHGLEPGAFIYIVDSAMVTQSNLEEMGDNLFITRLPFNYKEADRVVAEAVAKDEWIDIGAIAVSKPTRNRPVAQYRFCETTVNIHEQDYRAIVVHSSAHDKRRHKKIDREIAAEKKRITQSIREISKELFYCRADAESAAERLEKNCGPLHRIQSRIAERPVYVRGRPAKNKPRDIQKLMFAVEADVEKNTEAIETKRAEAGCFVLLTNVPETGPMAHTGEDILRAYKEQHGVERNFAFLKDPLIVNDLFLKNPERIEALGMILLISLLVSNLIERALRQYTSEEDNTLPGWRGRETKRPTTFMLITKFAGLQTIWFNDQVRLTRPLKPVHEAYLKALSITPEEFLNPWKTRPG